MGRKVNDVEKYLIRGLAKGLAGHRLYDFVEGRSGYFSMRRLKRASLSAMRSQPAAARETLEGIYSLAVYKSQVSTRCR